MASDAIEPWNPAPPEIMRMFIGSMLALGMSEDAVHFMTHDSPALALGLERRDVAPLASGVQPSLKEASS